MGDVLPQSHWASYALGLGERVRAIRLMRGLSQSRLAEISGVSRTLISNLERNDYNARAADPTLSTMYRLASALKVPPAALLPGAGDAVEGRFAGQTRDDGNPTPNSIVFEWPRGPRDTQRFDEPYLRRGAPAGTPAFPEPA